MSKPKKSTIEVQGTAITILSKEQGDYISLTDMVRNFEGGSALIEQWLKNKDTVLFLGVWEQIHNPDFNSLEFEGIRNEAGRNSFFLSAKTWIDDRCQRPVRQRRTLRRHLCPQGHRLRIRFVGQPGVQALPHQGIPAPQGRRKPPPLARVESQPHALQAQLPHPHRRHQGAPHPAGNHAGPSRHRLRHRGGCTQRRPLRPNCQAVA